MTATATREIERRHAAAVTNIEAVRDALAAAEEAGMFPWHLRTMAEHIASVEGGRDVYAAALAALAAGAPVADVARVVEAAPSRLADPRPAYREGATRSAVHLARLLGTLAND